MNGPEAFDDDHDENEDGDDHDGEPRFPIIPHYHATGVGARQLIYPAPAERHRYTLTPIVSPMSPKRAQRLGLDRGPTRLARKHRQHKLYKVPNVPGVRS